MASGYQLWSERYDRELEDVFAIQDEIAQSIVRMLKLKLVSPPADGNPIRATTRPEVYNLYLRGRFEAGTGTADALQRAVAYRQRATEMDPGFAPAWAALANCYSLLSGHGFLPTPEAAPLAEAAATRALRLDDSLAEAHTALAIVRAYAWDWTTAEEEFLRAIALNPGDAVSHQHYAALVLSPMGRTKDAVAEVRCAHSADPALSNHQPGFGTQPLLGRQVRRGDRATEG